MSESRSPLSLGHAPLSITLDIEIIKTTTVQTPISAALEMLALTLSMVLKRPKISASSSKPINNMLLRRSVLSARSSSPHTCAY